MPAAASERGPVTGADELVGVQGPETLDGLVRVDVTGGSDGDVAVHLVFDHGRLAALTGGAGGSPAATLTLAAGDARAVVGGSLDLSVAFMQGRLKVAGDMGMVLEVLALAATADARDRLSRVAGPTDG